MQALRYHLPIIASDVSSFREYIDGYGIGYLAKAGDALDLRDSILLAFDENIDRNLYDERMSKAVEDCSWEKAGAMYADLVKNLM